VTSPADRVAVPTNGHRPALTDDALDAPSVDASDAPGEATGATAPTVTPGQLIAGFGILAALILLLVGRRRPRG
jgi:hypothetical protein